MGEALQSAEDPDRLPRLAREVEVVALVRGADQLAGRAARADRDPLDLLRAVRVQERLAPAGHLTDA